MNVSSLPRWFAEPAGRHASTAMYVSIHGYTHVAVMAESRHSKAVRVADSCFSFRQDFVFLIEIRNRSARAGSDESARRNHDSPARAL